jgi:transposase
MDEPVIAYMVVGVVAKDIEHHAHEKLPQIVVDEWGGDVFSHLGDDFLVALKQFLVSMLCVDRNIPILGTTTDGNASDKTLNNELLTNISTYMARHGLEPGAYVYVADSAFVTEDNLKKADGRQTWFLTRLPATYNECGRIIREAVAADDWIDIGPLAEERDRPKRPVARYRAYDGTVELYGKTYRALVVHSSAHDKRRHKRIDRMLKQDRKQLGLW